jgi:hypothetical protein
MAQHHPPILDHTTRTLFLRLTIARAMTPRAGARVHALRELERLLAIAADRISSACAAFFLPHLRKTTLQQARHGA